MRGFVLSRTDFGEYDQLVGLFSPDEGYVRVRARGIKKSTSKNAAQLVVGGIVDAQVIESRGEFGTLGSVQIDEIFRNIYADSVLLHVSQYILHTIEQAVPYRGNQEELFNATYSLFCLFNTIDSLPAVVRTKYIVEWFMALLEQEGFLLDIRQCITCGGDYTTYVACSISGGGVLCKDCCKKALPETYIQEGVFDLITMMQTSQKSQNILAFDKIYTILHACGEYHFERSMPHILNIHKKMNGLFL